MDADIVSASPLTIYRVPNRAGRPDLGPAGTSKKGTGFAYLGGAHARRHVDVAHINIAGTLDYMCSVLDGFRRSVSHWEIRERMKETDIEFIIQRALEKHPNAIPRIASDGGPQLLARDFRTFLWLA
jgi:putative transposase